MTTQRPRCASPLTRGSALMGTALVLISAGCTSAHDADGSAQDASAQPDGAGRAAPDAALPPTRDGGSADAAAHAGTDGGHLAWYVTCGQPVCRTDGSGDAGADACDAGQQEHASCSVQGAECDPGLGCGAKLRCTTSDPKLGLGGCPISRAASKTEIRYLADQDLRRYHDEVVRLGLAHYVYRGDPSAQERLGFIIEDVEPSRFVDEARDRVDLYAYTSAVIAAVKIQERRIAELEQQVRALRLQTRRQNAR